MQDFFKTFGGYILSVILIVIGVIKDITNKKQREATRRETEANVRKAEISISDSLIDTLKEAAEEWRTKFTEEKTVNLELIKSNKILVESALKEQQDKAGYMEEIHQLRVEVAELKNVITKFQAQFPDYFNSNLNKK